MRLSEGKMNKLDGHNELIILAPRWKDKKVLIASWKLVEPDNRITITAERKDGTRFYPASYFISTKKIKTYPLEKMKQGAMYIVPLNDLMMPEGGV